VGKRPKWWGSSMNWTAGKKCRFLALNYPKGNFRSLSPSVYPDHHSIFLLPIPFLFFSLSFSFVYRYLFGHWQQQTGSSFFRGVSGGRLSLGQQVAD
jgi:hypothetical protein